jgi:MGT family glycosyltransferase
MHVGLLVPPFQGHLNPFASLARAFARFGHRATLITLPDGRARLREDGFELRTYGEKLFPAGSFAATEARMGVLSGRAGARAAIELTGAQCRAIFEELPPVLDALRLDLLVMDQVCVGAECLAARRELPLGVACAALPLHREVGVPPWTSLRAPSRSPLAQLRNALDHARFFLGALPTFRTFSRLRREHGFAAMRPRDLHTIPPSRAQVCQLPELLDFAHRKRPAHFHYSAPWVEARRTSTRDERFPWERLDGRPILYASLGTLQNRLDWIYAAIAEACRELPYQLVIALGREHATLPALPGAPLVVGYAPQLELLSRAHAVITHAGLNTALETLRAGLPCVALPITHEQPGIAARLVHRVGSARALALPALTPHALRAALLEILENPRYRAAAQRAAATLATLDGPALAASALARAAAPR